MISIYKEEKEAVGSTNKTEGKKKPLTFPTITLGRSNISRLMVKQNVQGTAL